MRHVDNAHQAVGDGQPQRHQQQDGTQADAAEHHAHPVTPSQTGFHIRQAALQDLAHGRRGLYRQSLGQQGLGSSLGTGPEQARGLNSAAFVSAREHGGGAQLAQGLGGVRFSFLRQCALQQGKLRFADLALQIFCSGTAQASVGRQQLERGQCVIQLPAHAVVIDHIFRGRQHLGAQRNRCAGDRVQGFVALKNIGFAVGDLDGVIGESLDECQGGSVGFGHCGLNSLHAGTALALRHRQCFLWSQRVAARHPN